MGGGVAGEALAEDRLQLGLGRALRVETSDSGSRQVLDAPAPLQMSRSGFCLKAPTMHDRTVAGFEHARQRERPPVQLLAGASVRIAASCICMASMVL